MKNKKERREKERNTGMERAREKTGAVRGR